MSMSHLFRSMMASFSIPFDHGTWPSTCSIVCHLCFTKHALLTVVLVRRWRSPQRWDVLVLQSPTGADELLVKRVVGLPGERVALRAGGVWADGRRVLPGNKSLAASVYYGAFGSPQWRLGDDQWFVVGDNQVVSVDSRNWAAPAGVPARLVVGVVAGRH